MKLPKFVIVLLTVFIVTPIFANTTLLVLGDSLSAAHGIETEQGWVFLLKKRLKNTHPNIQVINASISGDTTGNGLSRLPALLLRDQPRWIIIELGGNDGLRGLPLNIMKNNLSAMIQLSQQAGAAVILVGVRIPPNYGQRYFRAFQEVYRSLAKTYRVAFVPEILENVAGHPSLMQADGIHPRANAQAIMLDNIWPVLAPILSHESAQPLKKR